MLFRSDDKFAFMQQCHEHDIPVAEAWRFDNVAELEALLATHGHQPLCVKPVTGIFAQGFWRLDTDKEANARYDSFEHLYFTEEKKSIPRSLSMPMQTVLWCTSAQFLCC